MAVVLEVQKLCRMLPDCLPPYSYTFFLPEEKEEVRYMVSLIDFDAIAAWPAALLKLAEDVPIFSLSTSGDGNCLVSAISRAMWGSEYWHFCLRKELRKELERFPEFYRKVASNSLASPISDTEWEKVCMQAGTNRSFLSNIHIMALASAICRPILLFAPDNAVEGYGYGISGVGGEFLPFDVSSGSWYPVESWTGPPLAVVWSSNSLSHFVPLVGVGGKNYPQWPPLPVVQPFSEDENHIAVPSEYCSRNWGIISKLWNPYAGVDRLSLLPPSCIPYVPSLPEDLYYVDGALVTKVLDLPEALKQLKLLPFEQLGLCPGESWEQALQRTLWHYDHEEMKVKGTPKEWERRTSTHSLWRLLMEMGPGNDPTVDVELPALFEAKCSMQAPLPIAGIKYGWKLQLFSSIAADSAEEREEEGADTLHPASTIVSGEGGGGGKETSSSSSSSSRDVIVPHSEGGPPLSLTARGRGQVFAVAKCSACDVGFHLCAWKEENIESWFACNSCHALLLELPSNASDRVGLILHCGSPQRVALRSKNPPRCRSCNTPVPLSPITHTNDPPLLAFSRLLVSHSFPHHFGHFAVNPALKSLATAHIPADRLGSVADFLAKATGPNPRAIPPQEWEQFLRELEALLPDYPYCLALYDLVSFTLLRSPIPPANSVFDHCQEAFISLITSVSTHSNAPMLRAMIMRLFSHSLLRGDLVSGWWCTENGKLFLQEWLGEFAITVAGNKIERQARASMLWNMTLVISRLGTRAAQRERSWLLWKVCFIALTNSQQNLSTDGSPAVSTILRAIGNLLLLPYLVEDTTVWTEHMRQHAGEYLNKLRKLSCASGMNGDAVTICSHLAMLMLMRCPSDECD
jgi:hypothetical protein